MNAIGTGARRRAIAVAIVVVFTMAASYVVVAREHIAAIDAFAFPDPTMRFSASHSVAPSGSAIHLEGASAGGIVEFSGDGPRAYSPTFVDGDRVAALVPPLFRGNSLAAGALQLRLLTRKGPIWTSSPKTTFTVGPVDASAPLGTATLFALDVTGALLTNALDAAATAAVAGAPAAVSEHAVELGRVRAEVEALATQVRVVAWGNGSRVTRSGLTIDAAGIRLMDQLMTSYFTSFVSAPYSPCDVAKDAKGGLTARSVEGANAAAVAFARSVVECDAQHLSQVAIRTTAWLSTLGQTAAEALRTDREMPGMAGLLAIVLASWTDEAVTATYVWKRYGHGAELRAYFLERIAGPPLPDLLRETAQQDAYLTGQFDRLWERGREGDLLSSISALDQAVAAALAARPVLLTTPTPMPVAPLRVFQGEIRTPLPSVSVRPGDLDFSYLVPPRWTVGKAVTFSFCVPRPASVTSPCGPGSTEPKGGRPPYTFTYIPPPGPLGGPGSTPSGLILHPNGIVTGTPSEPTLYTLDVCVNDAAGASVCQRIYGVINAAR